MAVEVLGRGVHHQIEAELERALHPRRGERVVRDAEDPAPAGDRRHSLEVDELQQRVRRRLDPHHARIGLERALQLVGARERQVGEPEPGAPLPDALEQAPGAAVEIVERDDVRAAVEELEHGGRRRHAGREREAVGARFERRHAALVGPPRRIVRARIVEPLVHAGAALHVGGSRVDGRDDRAGRGIGRLSGVNRERGELVRHLSFRRR
jgi:hypothetical protein